MILRNVALALGRKMKRRNFVDLFGEQTLDRRRFFRGAAGMAASFMALPEICGPLPAVSKADPATPIVGRYFVHLPPDGSSAVYWRGLGGFAGELIQINLNI